MNPTEAQEGAALVAYLRIRGHMFTHIPNETGGSPEARRRAIRMKQQGTSKGFPDYLIITKAGLVAVELKRVKGSKVSPEQIAWVKALGDCGVTARICKGAEEAIAFINEVEGTSGNTAKQRL